MKSIIISFIKKVSLKIANIRLTYKLGKASIPLGIMDNAYINDFFLQKRLFLQGKIITNNALLLAIKQNRQPI